MEVDQPILIERGTQKTIVAAFCWEIRYIAKRLRLNPYFYMLFRKQLNVENGNDIANLMFLLPNKKWAKFWMKEVDERILV